LAGELLGGGNYDPASHRGKVTVVNFWGSWCAPCRAETPELVAAYAQLRVDDVAFLGINVRDPDRDKAAAFVEAFHVPYPSIYDPPGRLALAFDVPPSTIPATVILDRDGTVAVRYRQGVLREQLVEAVRKVVASG
jgi:thiol-disulfide isomerase/thioredoxin